MGAIIEHSRNDIHFLRPRSMDVRPGKFRTRIYFKNLRLGAVCALPSEAVAQNVNFVAMGLIDRPCSSGSS